MVSDLFKLAAVKARDAAEEFFKLNNIDMAIRSVTAAKQFNPELPNIDGCFTAYKVRELATKNSTWYEIFCLSDIGVDSSMIKKQYKRTTLMLHPDKNHSVSVEGAFKLIQSAFQVLIVPKKRQSYDSSMRSKKRPHQSPHTASGSSNYSKSSRSTNEEAKSSHFQPQAAADHKARASSSGFGSINTKENCRGGCDLRNVKS